MTQHEGDSKAGSAEPGQRENKGSGDMLEEFGFLLELIPLLFVQRKRVLSDPSLYHASSPVIMLSMAYVGGESRLAVGDLLQLWGTGCLTHIVKEGAAGQSPASNARGVHTLFPVGAPPLAVVTAGLRAV